MLDEKLLEVLTSPPDTAISIVTQGPDEPHLVCSWNSYVHVTADDKLLIPMGGMARTEQNLARDNRIQLAATNREVHGKTYKGTGFLIKGTAAVATQGESFSRLKEKFPWARAVLEVTVQSAEQTL